MLTYQGDIEPEHVYLQVICLLAQRYVDHEERREAVGYPFEVRMSGGSTFTRQQQFWDYQISFERLKRKVYSLVERFEDIHTVVQVEPTNKGMYNTV